MPRFVDHPARKKAIVDVAWLLIAEEGFDAVTIRRLAKELGGATGRVTNYFSNKDEILVAVLDQLTASHQSGLATLSEALDAATHDVDAIAAAILESLPLDEERIRDWKSWLAFWGRATISPEIAERHRTIYASWRECLSVMLAKAAHADPSAELDSSAEQLLAFIDGLGIHLLIEPSRVNHNVLFDMVYQQVARSIEFIELKP